MSRTSKPETETLATSGIEGSNVVPIELGIEGARSEQTLGIFEPPRAFPREKCDMAWGAKKAGTVGAFPSVNELQQPIPHPSIGLMHPGWRVWKDAEGKEHTIKKGDGELVLMFCDKKDNQVINKAYGQLSQRTLKSIEQKIQRTTLVLPADVRAADDRIDEALKEQMLMAEALR